MVPPRWTLIVYTSIFEDQSDTAGAFEHGPIHHGPRVMSSNIFLVALATFVAKGSTEPLSRGQGSYCYCSI